MYQVGGNGLKNTLSAQKEKASERNQSFLDSYGSLALFFMENTMPLYKMSLFRDSQNIQEGIFLNFLVFNKIINIFAFSKYIINV